MSRYFIGKKELPTFEAAITYAEKHSISLNRLFIRYPTLLDYEKLKPLFPSPFDMG